MDYKSTLNLPTTDFPMRANLPRREPEMLARWQEMGLYRRLQEANADKPRFVLHDGPPYANGNIHIGHTLNKVLKDIIVKHRAMSGWQAPYIPGWDCHGLPIELQVEKKLGRSKKNAMPIADVRQKCRDYAQRFVEIQSAEFQRLGVFGDWDRPYLTMDHAFEAEEVRILGRCFEAGLVYRGKKPVLWCPSCRTALAEAEVEYEDVTSPSVYVAYPLTQPLPGSLANLGDVAAVAWTTTPWTLPASLAVAVHAGFEYVVVQHEGRRLLVAAGLAEALATAVGHDGPLRELGRIKGEQLEGLLCRHPWIDREVPIVVAEYVTLESGTGLVHTAPGHGQDDYHTGQRYGLEVLAPVDDGGRFTDTVPEWAGTNVFDANEAIVDHLGSVGARVAAHDFEHSYPHCWRCKHKIVFRATEQWFIGMEQGDLRTRALAEIDRVTWVPAWGRERIWGMISTRPDWCISRQRAWGVPVIALFCESCDAPLANRELCEHVATLFDADGADAWFTSSVSELTPPGASCGECQGTEFRRGTDILDVWFDSGVSWAAVVDERDELGGHADVYLEGSDQHRGWFHSALLTSVAVTGKAPYDVVLTHGFTLDGEGRKMSKTLGNVIAPDRVIKSSGAELLRLWVSAEDYRDDQRVSEEILQQQVESYRRLRNTARFLLSNLADWDPARHAVPYAELPALERWALHRTRDLATRVLAAYDAYEFHVIYHALNNFCSVDMSSIYLDVRKDRLYCEASDAPERRATQTVMHAILDVLVRVMAPICSFTADEIWQFMPGDDREDSVFLAGMPTLPDEWEDEALAARFDALLGVRAAITKAIEEARKDGELKRAPEVHVRMAGGEGITGGLDPDELAELALVSTVTMEPELDAAESDVVAGLRVAVARADGEKCPRCWIVRAPAGSTDHPELCERCLTVVA